MIKQFAVLSFITLLIGCSRHYNTNSIKDNESNTEISVKDWSSMHILIGNETWENGKKEIISQIGEIEFEAVKNNYSHRTIPDAFSAVAPQNRKNPAYFKKLDHLKMNKIATFRNYSNGKEWARLAILKVAYSENKNWDTTVHWDSIYFILPDSSLIMGKKASNAFFDKSFNHHSKDESPAYNFNCDFIFTHSLPPQKQYNSILLEKAPKQG